MDAWIGLAHVKPRETKDLLDGALGAFAPVVALAENENDFATKATIFLHAYDFDVVKIEDIEPLQSRMQPTTVDPKILELSEKLSMGNSIALSSFEAYESD